MPGTADRSEHLPQDVQEYLNALRDNLIVALGYEEVMQVFLVGSASYEGAYIPRQSDLDVAVVTRSKLSQTHLQRVPDLCAHSTLVCPAEKLELVVYAFEDVHLDSPRLPYNISLNFNTGRTLPHDHVRYGNNPDDSPHWFVLDIAAAHANSKPLLPEAPAFAEIFTPQLDRQQVIEALDTSLQWHIDNEATSANAVLNACRGWRWVDEGIFGSKLDGGRYALRQLASSKEPAGRAVRAAVAAREGSKSGEDIDAKDAESLYALIAAKLHEAPEAT